VVTTGERVIVVGAGVAGLAAAYRLNKAGLRVTVLERMGEVGGRMSTHLRDGYRIDIGASLLPTSYRHMLALIDEAGLADQIEPTSSLFGLVRDGNVHRFQAGNLKDMLGIPLSARSKVTLLRALWDCIRLGDKLFVPAELVVWAAGIKAPDFLKSLDGLKTDRINRLIVEETLRATGDDNVFAIGDCANCVLPGEDSALPPRAQTAHQQADHVVKVIAARLAGQTPPTFRYRDYGSLVSLADYGAFGNLIGGLKIEGLLARLAYRSLYKMHLKAVHGLAKTALASVGEMIARPAKPRIKLH